MHHPQRGTIVICVWLPLLTPTDTRYAQCGRSSTLALLVHRHGGLGPAGLLGHRRAAIFGGRLLLLIVRRRLCGHLARAAVTSDFTAYAVLGNLQSSNLQPHTLHWKVLRWNSDVECVDVIIGHKVENRTFSACACVGGCVSVDEID